MEAYATTISIMFLPPFSMLIARLMLGEEVLELGLILDLPLYWLQEEGEGEVTWIYALSG